MHKTDSMTSSVLTQEPSYKCGVLNICCEIIHCDGSGIVIEKAVVTLKSGKHPALQYNI